MPWLETSPVDEREDFIADDRRGLHTRAELCARYGISRKTGYKWLGRFAEDGRRGLQDRGHASHHRPHRIGQEQRRRHPPLHRKMREKRRPFRSPISAGCRVP